MDEMEDTVKQLRQDESELQNKIARRRQELERAEKRSKGLENVKPEYLEEYERLEADLERLFHELLQPISPLEFKKLQIAFLCHCMADHVGGSPTSGSCTNVSMMAFRLASSLDLLSSGNDVPRGFIGLQLYSCLGPRAVRIPS